jgi:2-keto-3-deoxy-6-phosphogluconate aldolase
LRLPNIVACGGSWLAPRHVLKACRFDEIAVLIAQAQKLLAPPPDVAT